MVGLRNKATDGFFLLLPTLMLFSYQTLCQAQGKIGFRNNAAATVRENTYQYPFERRVCHQPLKTTDSTVSFSITINPTSPDLYLYPTDGRINARQYCGTVQIRIYDTSTREDTRTFLISLTSTTVDVTVDENQGQFILHVIDDDDTGTSGSCPDPTVVKGQELVCHNNYAIGRTCRFECDDGYKRMSGNYERTCSSSSEWSGFPLYCIQTSCVTNAGDNSTCTCPAGLIEDGSSCIIDECRTDSCINGGSCVNRVNGYQCICVAGFTGTSCETDVNECSTTSPCASHTTCVNTPGSFECNCNPGYTGPYTLDGRYYCGDINECSTNSPCSSQATCVNTPGSFECNCNPGYTGRYTFDGRHYCRDINECSTNSPCASGATCVNTPGSFECNCDPGYTGGYTSDGRHYCIDMDECASNPCLHGATCRNRVNRFNCLCMPGYSGNRCQRYNYCHNMPCRNGATCTSETDDYSCTCSSYWTGRQCSVDVNECTEGSDVCSSYPNSHCHNLNGSYTCLCNSGFVRPSFVQGYQAFCRADTTPPEVSFCPSNIIQTVQLETWSTTVTWSEPIATDNSQNASLNFRSHAPGSNFDVGTTTVIYTFKDPAGNTANCVFDVSIVQDCKVLEETVCGSRGVSCDCMDEPCDPDTGICSSSCTIVNICPAIIQSVSLSQVNPSSEVDITCTLNGSRAILDRLRVQLSSKSNALDQNGIREVAGSEERTGSKVESTFRVKNVTSEKNLHCILLQGNYFIGGVGVIDFVHELPVLNAAPISGNVSNTTIAISWMAWDPTSDDGDPPIVAYIPYYRKNTSDEWTNGSRILSNETLQFKAEGLEVDTVYVFSVATVREGDNGEGPRSTPSTVKTFCNAPDVASSVNVTVTSSNKVNVSWQLPPGEMVCSTGVTSYTVYYSIKGSVETEVAGTVDDVNTRWLIIDDKLLQPGSLYTFFVTVTTDQESEFRESEPIQVSSDDEGGSSAGIIVAVISIIILLIILVLVILLIIKRKRDMKTNQAPRPVDNTYDNVSGSLTKQKWSAGATNATKPAFQMQLAERDDREKISLESFSVDEESSPDEIIYGNLEPPQPIRVAQFKDYFKQNIDKFEQEFSILKGSKKQFDWTVAENPVNKKKNRFKNIYTYDHSRVVLKTLPDQEGSDYYNASFIKNASGVKAYIAAQAPNKSSVDDFIRMIWEQNVTTVVMVANLFEEGKERCHQYWPETEGSHKSFGSVTVTWLKTRQFSDFVIRILSFKKGKKTHEVQQLHFLVWPDKDTPEHGTALIEFVKQSKQIHHGKKYPMLVHCSAGIGRTGTFICLSCMMDVLRDKEFIDVFAFVNKMRENRINMVQTSKQYVFLYKCLNEYHLTHQTEMSVHQMTGLNVDSHRGILLGEFELLSELVQNPTKDTDENCTGKMRENIARNRLGNMVPSNRNRVFLMSPGQSNKGNYINASYVKSFQKKDAFITTQSPLPNTIEDFWRMVYDVKSPLIVMLNQLDPTDKTCLQYWPNRGSREYGDMCVTCLATDEQPSSYICRTFDVKHTNSKGVVTVTHMQMKEWQPDINLEGIISLFKDVDIMQRDDQSTQPIIIHCVNGFERSGVMVTVKSEFERLAVTDKIDVFSTVKKLRDQHEHMLKNEDDYILCYHLLKAYLNSNDSNYENF